MSTYPESVRRTIASLRKLPGIGVKTAERLVFSLLRRRKQDAVELADAIHEMVEKVGYCRSCRNYAETSQCAICSDARRDRKLICVVEQPEDVFAIERTGEFKGVYFVLHGSIAPLDGVGPEELGVDELVTRAVRDDVREIILATNPNVAGEATAIYVARKLAATGIAVSRIALGIPAGGHIGYADEVTMLRALEGRSRISLD